MVFPSATKKRFDDLATTLYFGPIYGVVRSEDFGFIDKNVKIRAIFSRVSLFDFILSSAKCEAPNSDQARKLEEIVLFRRAH